MPDVASKAAPRSVLKAQAVEQAAPKKEKKEPDKPKPDLVWLSVVDPADPKVLGKRVLVSPAAVSLVEETPLGVPYSMVMVGGVGVLARGDVPSIVKSLGLVVKE